MIQRIRGVARLSALTLSLLLASLGPASAASASDFSVLSHNTQGAGKAGADFAYIYDRMNGPTSPIGFSLQELCYSVYQSQIFPFMQNAGYINSGFYTQDNSARNCPGGYYGVAVFLKGSIVSNGSPHRFAHQFSGDTDDRGRGFRCVESSIYLLQYALCSTHLANGLVYDTADRNALNLTLVAQAEDMRAHLNQYGAGRGSMVGGDFNQNPAAITNSFYNQYYELDQANRYAWWPYRTTTMGGQHYDYVWAQKSYFGYGGTGTIGDYHGSDHRFLRAFFNWP